MRPDLSDPAARAACRAESRPLARGWRPSGLAPNLIGGGGPWAASWAMIANVHRGRHHEARMAGGS